MSNPHDLTRLRAAVSDIDCLSQQGFGQIAAIARLALMSMEVPAAYRHPDVLATAMDAILNIAKDIQNCINAAAEDVGCNYIDSPERRRMAAKQQGESA